ncbi:glycosyltransferase [Flavicella sp.]|uniref:glycosyltransferase n=1 Tax=Flavicella sp. TaxID=2957742 RepID=UPI00262EE17D|nr:glycosyltransferase [Flavicella sp.]MDG1804984.1 glycosyltransferase [Flavicella sp.]MDG2280349.1 glycosyltransferase [Flavicella sp.]
MKILFVCMQYIHSARWINQLKDSGHEIYVFDCLDKPIHEDLLWTNFITGWSKRKLPYLKGEYFLEKKLPYIFRNIEPFLKITASEKLIQVIEEIQPDLVHSLEMQSETYPLLKARKKIDFKWAYFSWGSDLYLYQNNLFHRKRIKNILKNLNYLFVDNSRDIELAKKLSFKTTVAGIFPGGGGYEMKSMNQYKLPLSEKKLILIKGYHHWAGRALVVLDAFEKNIDLIREFNIYLYSAHDKVVERISYLNSKYKLNIEYSSRYKEISHEQLLEKFGQAKVAIGNSISDGVPNTLLEAILLGAFPIQSNPGGASEDYITHGENGFLIENPEDPKEIASHIMNALNNEDLLSHAYSLNHEIAKDLDYQIIKDKVVALYKKIEKEL